MTFESDIEKTVVELIVYKYRQRKQALETSNSEFVSDISISFRQLFNSLPGKYSFGENLGSLCYRMDLDIKKEVAKIKDINERIRVKHNRSLLFQADFLQAIVFLKRLEDNNLIIIVNDFNDVDRLPHFDSQEDPLVFVHDKRIEEYIKHFLYSDIIPTTTLIDIYDNNFETEDKRRYKKQVRISWIGILVAIVTPIFLKCCDSDTKIDKAQYNEVINELKCINKNILNQ